MELVPSVRRQTSRRACLRDSICCCEVRVSMARIIHKGPSTPEAEDSSYSTASCVSSGHTCQTALSLSAPSRSGHQLPHSASFLRLCVQPYWLKHDSDDYVTPS